MRKYTPEQEFLAILHAILPLNNVWGDTLGGIEEF